MILLAVTGSIAAYKAVEVLRLLTQARHEVRVVMTDAATRFVGPLTFQALSGHPVLVDLLDPKGWEMAHLELSGKAAAMLIVPASAEALSRLARGSAGDIVSASALSLPRNPSGKLKTPLFIAPAMHEQMWLHPATQANVETLKAFGYTFVGPVKGPLGRVGDEGMGRLAEPSLIAQTVLRSLKSS